MNEEIKIREAEPTDAALIVTFIKELAAYEKLAHEVIVCEKDLLKYLFGNKSCAEVVLAEINNQPVGFALFFHNFSTFVGKPGIYLEDLYIRPDFRGKNIGKQMLTYLARLAKERDCGRLEWSVLDWNQPAIDFYKKAGAIPMDEWTVFRVFGSALNKLANIE